LSNLSAGGGGGVSTGRTTAVFGVRAAIGGTERAALAVPPWDPLALATPVMPEGGRVAAAVARRSWEGFCLGYFLYTYISI